MTLKLKISPLNEGKTSLRTQSLVMVLRSSSYNDLGEWEPPTRVSYQLFALVDARGTLRTHIHGQSDATLNAASTTSLMRQTILKRPILTRGPATPGRPTGPLLPRTPCRTVSAFIFHVMTCDSGDFKQENSLVLLVCPSLPGARQFQGFPVGRHTKGPHGLRIESSDFLYLVWQCVRLLANVHKMFNVAKYGGACWVVNSG